MDIDLVVFFLMIPTVATTVLGLWVLYNNPSNRINITFFLITLAFLFWSGISFMLWTVDLPERHIDTLIHFAYAGPTAIMYLFLYFSFIFPRSSPILSNRILLLITIPPVLILIMIAQGNLIEVIDHETREHTGLWSFYAFVVFLILYISLIVFNLLKKAKGSTAGERHYIMVILFGFLVSTVLAFASNVIVPFLFGSNEFTFLGPAFFNLIFAATMTYAIINYSIMDIKIIAKKAFLYSVLVATATLSLGLLLLVSRAVEERYPDLSVWVIPLSFSMVAVGVAWFIWKKLRETDYLKYEFITVVSHKFRTPLTHIKWLLEEMASTETDNERLRFLSSLRQSSDQLVDLTNFLIILARADDIEKTFSLQTVDVSALCREVADRYEDRARKGDLSYERSFPAGIQVRADEKWLSFVIQTLIENALSYTPRSGQVAVQLAADRKSITITVNDTGIGIARAKLFQIFSRFYRGVSARRKDTEGLGVKLYISRQIIRGHGGSLTARSKGEGKGSTFTVTLPRGNT